VHHDDVGSGRRRSHRGFSTYALTGIGAALPFAALAALAAYGAYRARRWLLRRRSAA